MSLEIEDDDVIMDTGIKNAKFCASKIVPMFAIKWDPVPEATHYVVSFSDKSPSQIVEKTQFRLPDDFNHQTCTPYVQAFKGSYRLTAKHPFKGRFCNLVFIGPQ